MYALSYAEPCTPTLSGGRPRGFDDDEGSLNGMFGLGAALTLAQRKAKQEATKAANLAKRTQRRAVAAAKKAARVAGRTVQTSNPAAAEKLNKAVQTAQSQLRNVTALATTARRTRSKVDVQKALVAAQSAAKFISALNSPVTQPVAAKVQRLRGMGYMGTCQDSGAGDGSMIDDATGQPCDPTTGLPYGDAGGGGYPTQSYPQQPTYPQQPVYGQQQPYGGGLSPTGLVPGFGLPQFGSAFSQFGQNYGPLRACNTGSNLPRCIIYQMAVDEQNQFQFVFSILQQMYAQLLQIVQQLLAQLQSAQQQPYGGAYNQYQQTPYGPYGDPNNPYGGAAYGGQYPGPGYPGVPYYPGGADSSVIPPGYGDAGGGDPFGAGGTIPGDITQVFPGPGPMQQGPFAQGPSQPTNIISSDSLPDGADTTVDSFGGGDQSFVPSYTPAPQSSQPLPVQSSGASQSVTSGPTTPTVIVLQQGPGQSSYADTGLPAGPSQDQPSLEPPEIEGWAREN